MKRFCPQNTQNTQKPVAVVIRNNSPTPRKLTDDELSKVYALGLEAGRILMNKPRGWRKRLQENAEKVAKFGVTVEPYWEVWREENTLSPQNTQKLC